MKKLLLVSFAIAGALSAQAQVLLNIDLISPTSATITATSAASLVSSSNANFGVQLRDFYTASIPGTFGGILPFTGELKPAQSAIGYWGVFRYDNFPHLILQSYNLQTFIAGQQAFSGSITVNFSEAASLLRTGSYVGDIHILNTGGQSTGEVIGQYRINAVPEPATMTALCLGTLALLRRRKS